VILRNFTRFPTKDTLVILVFQNLQLIYYEIIAKKVLYIAYLIQLSTAQFSRNGDDKVRNKTYYIH